MIDNNIFISSADNAYGVVFLLLFITVAVFLFINFGSYDSAYKYPYAAGKKEDL